MGGGEFFLLRAGGDRSRLPLTGEVGDRAAKGPGDLAERVVRRIERLAADDIANGILPELRLCGRAQGVKVERLHAPFELADQFVAHSADRFTRGGGLKAGHIPLT